MSQNLILTIIDNYDYFRVERFLNSLKRTNYNGHLCVFSGPGNDSYLLKKLRKLDIEIVPYKLKFPFVEDPHPLNFKSLPEPIHIFNYRHFIYYDYLLKNEGRFDKVLISDMRDVVFQRDPFDFELEDSLYVAMETTKIAEDEWTSKWILAGYPPEVLLGIENNLVTCAGTTIGTYKHITRYLKTMLDEISVIRDAYNCADQAMQNVLLNEGKLDPVLRLENKSGIIMTVGTANPDSFKIDSEGFLLGGNGRRANIVHQADKHLQLQATLDQYIFKKPLIIDKARKLYKKFPQLSPFINQLKRLIG